MKELIGKLFLISLALSLVLSISAVSALAEDEAPEEEQAQVWPIEIPGPNGSVIVYQPQPETYKDNKLTARAAVAVILKGETEPVFGAVWFEARLATDRENRMVTIDEIDVPQVRFPEATQEQEQKLAKFLIDNFPKEDMVISQDRLLTTLEFAEKERIAAENLETKPPKIIFSTTPAILISIDGKPELQQIKDSKLMRVVNTPFILIFDPKSKAYFLKGGEAWFTAPDIKKPWAVTNNPPQEILDLASKMEPAQSEEVTEETVEEPEQPDPSNPPQVIVVTEPTELIVTEGEPKFTPLPGSELMYISNTDSDVFLDPASETYYVLLSGRWYSNTSLDKGRWSYVAADELPEAFAAMPDDSEKAPVLASVAGTVQAKEAVLDAGIPQTAKVERDKSELEVIYDGDPKFKKIEGTPMEYAVNTPYSVIEAEDHYYCCHEAVWYESEEPVGPWSVADSIPKVIYTIPPECPVYNVKYVYIYDSTPEVVYVGYLPGYTGSYVYGPTVVYGTGYNYHGWYGTAYYPRPVTWGFHASYNPWTGSWGFGFGMGGGGWYNPVYPGGGWFAPGFGAGFAAGFITGKITSGWWGPGGWHGHRNVNINVNRNIYNRPGRRPGVHPGRPHARPPRPTPYGKNNIFTDPKGNVFRRTQNGWQQRTPGGWTKPKPGAGPGRPDGPVRPGRPDGPIKPGTGPGKPGQPGQRPSVGTKPGQVKPGQPGVKPPTRPGQKPAKPSQPGTKPSTRPSQKPARPSQPSVKPPAKPSQKPAQRPTVGTQPRPSQPTRPSVQQPARPSQKPAQRPSNTRLENQNRARQRGTQRTNNFQRYQGGGGQRGGGRGGRR